MKLNDILNGLNILETTAVLHAAPEVAAADDDARSEERR